MRIPEKNPSHVVLNQNSIMKFAAALLLGLGAVNAIELTPDNWDSAVAGKIRKKDGRLAFADYEGKATCS